jgi:hypothetical protein
LRQLIDHKGQALVDGVLEIVDRLKKQAFHCGRRPAGALSRVELLLPQLLRGDSRAGGDQRFRTLGAGWAGMPLHVFRLMVSRSMMCGGRRRLTSGY